MNETISLFESSWIDISTTDEEYFNVTPINWFTIRMLITVPIAMAIVLGYKEYRTYKKNDRPKTWEDVQDPQALRSPYKSLKSIKMYIEQQSVTTEMVVSNLFLAGSIAVNTYTNIKGYWHYHNNDIDLNDKASVLYGADATALLSMLELVLTVTFTFCTFIWFAFKAYGTCVIFTCQWLPNISTMIYFAYLNPKIPKQMICGIWGNEKVSFVGKLCKLAGMILVLVVIALFGVWVFVVKVNQIAYIYQRSLSELGVGDFILILGVARQFATLYTMGGSAVGYEFKFIAITPNIKKESGRGDPDWKKRYDVDEVVCQIVIREYGFFGFCWCCYIFSEIENVQTLYLEEKNLDSKAGSISLLDIQDI